MSKWKLYILHFDETYNNKKHYAGIAINPTKRLKVHKAGRGGQLPGQVARAGINIRKSVVEEFEDHGDALRAERKLKRTKKIKQFCPICKLQKKFIEDFKIELGRRIDELIR